MGENRTETHFKVTGDLISVVDFIGVIGDTDQRNSIFDDPQRADDKDEIDSSDSVFFKGAQKR